jgi:vacuolar iron transporter family protein
MTNEQHQPSASPTAAGLWGTVGKYLPDIIFGASDGIITTLAVVSGVVGASLSTTVILILGFANLLADGFSMGASNVLSRRSETRGRALPTLEAAASHGIATFIGFVAAGIVPLLAYLLPWFDGARFMAATALAS